MVWHKNFAMNIQIEDNGCGIPKEDLLHIFEHFHNKERTAVKTASSSGLQWKNKSFCTIFSILPPPEKNPDKKQKLKLIFIMHHEELCSR